jgi:hypothetical protein
MNIRDKHTDMDEIHREEEKYLLGNQIPFNLADRPEQEIAGYESINVRLLHPSNSIVESELFQDWVRGAVITALTTWGSTSDGMNRVLDLANDPDSAVMALTEILCDRHISAVLESFAFTFYIDGIPRTMSHQIVRHRGMAFGQQSLRVSSCYGDVVRAPQDAINRVLQLEREIEETDSQIKAARVQGASGGGPRVPPPLRRHRRPVSRRLPRRRRPWASPSNRFATSCRWAPRRSCVP